MELIYQVKNSDLYFKLLNWLAGEFGLYQCEMRGDRLIINYPLVKCRIKKEACHNKVVAKVIITGQSLKDSQQFLGKFEDLYKLFKRRYAISK